MLNAIGYNKKTMKKFAIIFFLFLAGNGFAQQDAIYSQYMYNPFAINPAYAGTRNSYSAVLLHRSQWVGIDGSPMTQTFAMHAPAGKSGLSWGVNLSHDQLGPTKNLVFAGTGAYQIKLGDSKLSFGLRAGIYNSVLDRDMLEFKEDNDIFDVGGKVSAMVPSFDFGMYYYTTKFYIGLSSTHLSRHQFNFDGYPVTADDGSGIYLRTHAMLASGYVFEFNRKFVLKPSVLLKATTAAPLNVDFNVSAMFYKKFWLGVSLRNYSSVNFMTEFNITDYMRLGYAYDLSINKLGSYTNGTHEIFIGFDFNLKNIQTVSPRYL